MIVTCNTYLLVPHNVLQPFSVPLALSPLHIHNVLKPHYGSIDNDIITLLNNLQLCLCV